MQHLLDLWEQTEGDGATEEKILQAFETMDCLDIVEKIQGKVLYTLTTFKENEKMI